LYSALFERISIALNALISHEQYRLQDAPNYHMCSSKKPVSLTFWEGNGWEIVY